MADSLWSNVAALLQFDGNFADEKGHTVTTSLATLHTSTPIAGSGSLDLNDGTVTIALDAPIASQVFSVEFVIRMDATPADGTYWILGPEADGLSVAWYADTGDIGLNVWADGTNIFDALCEPDIGVPMHIEITWTSGTYYLFIDGALIDSSVQSVALSATTAIIGRAGASYGVWPGLIDGYRLTVGAVRHTAAFTPDYGVLDGAPSGPVYVADGGSSAAVFRAKVLIDSVDRTDDVVGAITIEMEEGAATIAEITLKPDAGTPIYLPAWTGLSVVISIGDFSSGGLTEETVRFTGKVDLPTVDFASGTLGLRCTDDLQGVVGAMTEAALASLIGGYYSDAVFEPGSSWVYANDRLATVRASMDISPSGTLRVTNWEAKTTADVIVTEDNIADGSLAIDMADRSTMVNRVDVVFGYRFPRMKAEGYECVYDALAPTDFEDYILDGKYIPARSQVEQAIAAAGGNIVSITYDALPTTSVLLHDTGGAVIGVWIPNPYIDPSLCTGWSAVVSFDYAQEFDETHNITVHNTQSITEIGTIKESMSGAMAADYADTTSVETTATLYKASVTGIPPLDTATVISGMTNSSDVTVESGTDRAAAENAMETLIATAKARIAAAHRNNTVSFVVPLNGNIDVSKTVSVSTTDVVAKGKVRKVVDVIDTDAGTATSAVDLAISGIAGVGITHIEDATNAPAGTTAGPSSTLTAPTVVFNNASSGDHTITITFPGVDDAERLRANPVINTTIRAAIPEDVFTVSL